MSGLVTAPLTDKELTMLEAWYLAHHLAGENSAEDDALVAKIKGWRLAVACRARTGAAG